MSSDLRLAFLAGAEIVSKLVKSTYGPYGKNVLLERFSGIIPTKDGATVVREAGDSDRVKNAAIRVIQEACVAVEEKSGDGTSTTALLAVEILRAGVKLTTAGICPMQLNREIQEAASRAVRTVHDIACKDLTEDHILSVLQGASKGDDEVSRSVLHAVTETGEYGNIIVQKGNGVGIEVEFREGMVLDKGWRHPYSNSDRQTCEGCFVAVFKQAVSSSEDILDCLETATQWPHNSLVIFSPRFQGEALKIITMNIGARHSGQENSNLKDQHLIPVSMKTVHEDRSGVLEDIAALTGATVIDRKAGYDPSKFNPDWFGSARKVDVSALRTEIVAYPDAEDRVSRRIEVLTGELSRCEFDHDRDRLQERIASLDGGLCLLKVGGYTEMEIKERMARVEDAVLAASSAIRTGVVPGAGNALIEASRNLNGDTLGEKVLKEALLEPTRTLIESRDPDRGSVVIDRIRSLWEGWDSHSRSIRDLRQSPPILDAAASVAEAIRASASVAGMLLTTEVFVHDHRRRHP